MTNIYRDDIQETIGYSDNTLAKSKTITEEIIRASEDLKFLVRASMSDHVTVLDHVVDSAIYPTKDTITISELYTGKKKHRQYIFDGINLSDEVKAKIRVKSFIYDDIGIDNDKAENQRANTFEKINYVELFKGKQLGLLKITEVLRLDDLMQGTKYALDHLLEGGILSDAVSKLRLITPHFEKITYQEYWKGKKSTRSFVHESIRVSDRSGACIRDNIIENIKYSESLKSKALYKQLVVEILTSDELIKQSRKSSDYISDLLTFFDQKQDKKTAKQQVNDFIYVEDDYSRLKNQGYAWTANIGNWAMSRYDDYPYIEMVVIDGVLYGVGLDGLYIIDADLEKQGTLQTGALDIGQGSLVHPTAAYLEYELSGLNKQLSIDVTTTQSGSKQSYTYTLPKEQSDHLTNGRVVFGRGLRGRHFSFTLKLNGDYGYINDISIDLTKTTRRI